MASDAVDSGKVQVNAVRVKPAKELKPGDQLEIRIGAFRHAVTVIALADRRGPASEAAKLYLESDASRAERELTAQRLRASAALNPFQKGRPTKKARRDLDRLKTPSKGQT